MTGHPNHAICDLLRFWRLHHGEPDPFMDFGSLDVSWPLDTRPSAPIQSFRATLEVFYQLSYELYRLELGHSPEPGHFYPPEVVHSGNRV
jgi:hypothetical protein